jgi:peroxiredoxin
VAAAQANTRPELPRSEAMTIKVGDTLPETSLTTMGPDGPQPIGPDFFKGRTIALFAVPGAFTPTCSAKHLPSFIEKADAIKAKGIDEIACVSVNDVFVMSAWGKANDVDGKVTMIADGNGDLARALGLVMDGSKFGMGTRSQRYAMIVKDWLVTALDVEAPGEYRVSSAEHLLGQL